MSSVFRLIWNVVRRIGPSQISVISAGIAFYALLSVFPATTAIIALAGLFIEPEAVVGQLEVVTRFVPEEAAGILVGEASKVAGAGNEGLSLAFALGVVFSIYLSTRATTALIHGLNRAHGRSENRGFFRYCAVVFALTAALVFGVASMFVLLVLTPTVLAFIPAEIVPVTTSELVQGARWVLVGLLLVFGLSVLYRFGPTDRMGRSGPARRPWRWLTPGSALAASLWFAASFGFSLYVTHFADYNASFGSLGGVIVLLTWLWLSAFVVLLGALLDSEHRRTQPSAD